MGLPRATVLINWQADLLLSRRKLDKVDAAKAFCY